MLHNLARYVYRKSFSFCISIFPMLFLFLPTFFILWFILLPCRTCPSLPNVLPKLHFMDIIPKHTNTNANILATILSYFMSMGCTKYVYIVDKHHIYTIQRHVRMYTTAFEGAGNTNMYKARYKVVTTTVASSFQPR